MADHLFLPTLSKTETGITPPEKGLWANQHPKIILDIANGIEITEKASKRGISSIPDIWARPLMFQSAIRQNSKHPLKERLINEWRGLMSLLALSKYKKYDLTITPVELLGDQKFVKALKSLSPKGIQLENKKIYNWIDPELKEPILIIKFKDVPIGSFSPSTLVYTGSDYAKLLLIKAPELKNFLIDSNGYLIPPTKDTDKEEIGYVGNWLCEYQKRLGKLVVKLNDTKGKQTINNINGLINDWLKEIRVILDKAPDEEIKADGVKVSEKIEIKLSKSIKYFEEGKYKIYQYLLCPLVIDDSDKKEEKYSEITLDSTRNLTDYKEIIIITEKLLVGGGKIWDIKSLKDLGGDSSYAIERYFKNAFGTKIDNVETDFKTKDGKKAGMWIRPELFFLSNTLLKAKDGDFISEKETELNHNIFVWPFKKEILNFFTPTEIKKKLDPKITQDGGSVKFSFTLPVSGADLQIEKVYRAKGKQDGEGEILETDVPVIDIFPNDLGENWRQYYLFQSDSERFKVTPIFFTNNMEQISKEYNANYSGQSQKVCITSISGDNCFPEGLEIFYGNNKSGLILIDKRERNQPLEDKWTIGIDFGTSNTNVYKKINEDGSPKPWDCDFPNLTRCISKSKSDLRSKYFNDFFIPTNKIDLPITTTIKMYSRDEDENKNILTDYFIYFPEDTIHEFSELVLSNIKWDGEIINTKYFLKNLLFLVLVEVVDKYVANVQFAYSWPKAFSPETRNIFQETWELVYNELVLSNKRVLNAKSPESGGNIISIQPPTLNVSEGVAAGEFFASKLNLMHSSRLRIASVCLDVGGGTTDISVWWQNNIIEDFSVLFAGKQISNLLQKSGMLRKLLFSPEACVSLEAKKDNPTKFSAVLNHVFKVEDKEICSRLVNLANDEKVKRFRQMIAIEFGALAYYAGMVCFSVGTRNNKDGKSLLTEISSGGISLYWGGNAAKLISWIDFGNYRENGLASFILNALFYNCLTDKSLGEQSIGIKTNLLQQIQSPRFKSEVSGGLVAIEWDKKTNQTGEKNNSSKGDDMDVDTSSDSSSDNINQLKSNFVVCGENIEIKGKKIPFYSIVNDKVFFDGNNTLFSSDSIQTTEQLSKFITIMNTIGVRKGFFTEDSKIILSEQEKQSIINKISGEFLNNQTFRSETRTIEPIFIMEVRHLMDILWNKWNK